MKNSVEKGIVAGGDGYDDGDYEDGVEDGLLPRT